MMKKLLHKTYGTMSHRMPPKDVRINLYSPGQGSTMMKPLIKSSDSKRWETCGLKTNGSIDCVLIVQDKKFCYLIFVLQIRVTNDGTNSKQ
jgi:hypothetical protein